MHGKHVLIKMEVFWNLEVLENKFHLADSLDKKAGHLEQEVNDVPRAEKLRDCHFGVAPPWTSHHKHFIYFTPTPD